jgi:hypothetical protein
VPNTYTKIASTTVGVLGASSITFSSIPSTYTDLVIKSSLRDSTASLANAGIRVIFNGSGAGYTMRSLYGNGFSGYSINETSASWVRVGQTPAATATSNTFSNDEIYIANYLTSNNKSVSADSVMENNATESYAYLVAGLWANSAAITSITLQSNSTSWVQYSSATLYGISKT